MVLLFGFPFLTLWTAPLGLPIMFIGSALIALGGLFAGTVPLSPPLSEALFASGVLTFLFGLM